MPRSSIWRMSIAVMPRAAMASRSGRSTERRPMKHTFSGGTGASKAGKPSKPGCPVT